MKIPSKEWSKKIGKRMLDLSGEMPMAADVGQSQVEEKGGQTIYVRETGWGDGSAEEVIFSNRNGVAEDVVEELGRGDEGGAHS